MAMISNIDATKQQGDKVFIPTAMYTPLDHWGALPSGLIRAIFDQMPHRGIALGGLVCRHWQGVLIDFVKREEWQGVTILRLFLQEKFASLFSSQEKKLLCAEVGPLCAAESMAELHLASAMLQQRIAELLASLWSTVGPALLTAEGINTHSHPIARRIVELASHLNQLGASASMSSVEWKRLSNSFARARLYDCCLKAIHGGPFPRVSRALRAIFKALADQGFPDKVLGHAIAMRHSILPTHAVAGGDFSADDEESDSRCRYIGSSAFEALVDNGYYADALQLLQGFPELMPLYRLCKAVLSDCGEDGSIGQQLHVFVPLPGKQSFGQWENPLGELAKRLVVHGFFDRLLLVVAEESDAKIQSEILIGTAQGLLALGDSHKLFERITAIGTEYIGDQVLLKQLQAAVVEMLVCRLEAREGGQSDDSAFYMQYREQLSVSHLMRAIPKLPAPEEPLNLLFDSAMAKALTATPSEISADAIAKLAIFFLQRLDFERLQKIVQFCCNLSNSKMGHFNIPEVILWPFAAALKLIEGEDINSVRSWTEKVEALLWVKGGLQCCVASELWLRGQRKEAEKLALAIEDPDQKHKALSQLVRNYAESGDFDTALLIIHSMEDSTSQTKAIAIVQEERHQKQRQRKASLRTAAPEGEIYSSPRATALVACPQLPCDILYQIFSGFSRLEMLLLGLVCRTWHTVLVQHIRDKKLQEIDLLCQFAERLFASTPFCTEPISHVDRRSMLGVNTLVEVCTVTDAIQQRIANGLADHWKTVKSELLKEGMVASKSCMIGRVVRLAPSLSQKQVDDRNREQLCKSLAEARWFDKALEVAPTAAMRFNLSPLANGLTSIYMALAKRGLVDDIIAHVKNSPSQAELSSGDIPISGICAFRALVEHGYYDEACKLAEHMAAPAILHRLCAAIDSDIRLTEPVRKLLEYITSTPFSQRSQYSSSYEDLGFEFASHGLFGSIQIVVRQNIPDGEKQGLLIGACRGLLTLGESISNFDKAIGIAAEVLSNPENFRRFKEKAIGWQFKHLASHGESDERLVAFALEQCENLETDKIIELICKLHSTLEEKLTPLFDLAIGKIFSTTSLPGCSAQNAEKCGSLFLTRRDIARSFQSAQLLENANDQEWFFKKLAKEVSQIDDPAFLQLITASLQVDHTFSSDKQSLIEPLEIRQLSFEQLDSVKARAVMQRHLAIALGEKGCHYQTRDLALAIQDGDQKDKALKVLVESSLAAGNLDFAAAMASAIEGEAAAREAEARVQRGRRQPQRKI
jgi:hypothetical protein